MKASLLCWIYCRISGVCTVVFCDFLPLGFQQINPKLPAPVKILFFPTVLQLVNQRQTVAAVIQSAAKL